jgi:asparagine synthase (glutamine-hydrolysing)
LAGWQSWGIDLLPRLIGMFSFAVLDIEKSVLVLVRDPFGIKPLYYARSSQGLVFASEIAPLLDFPGVSRKANAETSYEFLAGGMGDHSDKTFYRDVFQLPAAHYLAIECHSPATAEPARYWELRRGTAAHRSPEEASGRFRKLFEESIRYHLRSEVPVGVSLSGGTDSSSITAMARAVQGPEAPLQTFSYVADDPKLSEQRWCTIVAQAALTQQHWIRIRAEELREDFQQLVRVQEQPFGSPTIYAQYRVYRCAHEAGVKVILSGQGSDQYLGYIRHASVRLASLIRSGRWATAFGLLRHWGRLPTREALSLRTVARQLLPRSLLTAARQWRPAVPLGMNVEWFRSRGFYSSNRNHLVGYRSLHELLKENVLRTLPSLLRFEDRNAMAFSVENRVPFITTNLLDFVFSLPEEEIISNEGQSKAVLHRAMRGVVPAEILERRDKIGFAMPLFKINHESASWLRTALNGVAEIPALRASDVHRHLSLTLSGRLSDTNSLRLLWRWLSFISWAREFNVRFD